VIRSACISTIIWLGVPAFQDVPAELEEAARLDGLGSWNAFQPVFVRRQRRLAKCGLDLKMRWPIALQEINALGESD
jgi:ABC-type maltose transport system permease subunit